MRNVWKFNIPIEDEFTLLMPKGAQPLSVQIQYGGPMLWALVDPDAEKESRRFAVHGTGHPVPENRTRFIDTFQMYGGELVFHVFEVQP